MRKSTWARLRTSGNAVLTAATTSCSGSGRTPVGLCGEVGDVGHAGIERAVEVAIARRADDLLSLHGAGVADEVRRGVGLVLVDPVAGQHDGGVVGAVEAVGGVDRNELLLGRRALDAGHAVAAGDPAVVVPHGLLVDDDGREEVRDRALVVGLTRVPEEVLGRRHVVAGRQLVLAHGVLHGRVFDGLDGEAGEIAGGRSEGCEHRRFAGCRDHRTRLAELEGAPLGVAEVAPQVCVGGGVEHVAPRRAAWHPSRSTRRGEPASRARCWTSRRWCRPRARRSRRRRAPGRATCRSRAARRSAAPRGRHSGSRRRRPRPRRPTCRGRLRRPRTGRRCRGAARCSRPRGCRPSRRSRTTTSP